MRGRHKYDPNVPVKYKRPFAFTIPSKGFSPYGTQFPRWDEDRTPLGNFHKGWRRCGPESATTGVW